MISSYLAVDFGYLDPDGTWTEHPLGALFTERRESNCVDLPLLSVTRKSGVVLHGEANRKDSSAQDKSNYKRITPADIGYNTMRMWQGISALSNLEGIISPAYTVCTPGPCIFRNIRKSSLQVSTHRSSLLSLFSRIGKRYVEPKIPNISHRYESEYHLY